MPTAVEEMSGTKNIFYSDVAGLTRSEGEAAALHERRNVLTDDEDFLRKLVISKRHLIHLAKTYTGKNSENR